MDQEELPLDPQKANCGSQSRDRSFIAGDLLTEIAELLANRKRLVEDLRLLWIDNRFFWVWRFRLHPLGDQKKEPKWSWSLEP